MSTSQRCARVALICLLLAAAGAEFAAAARPAPNGPVRSLLQRSAAQTLATLNAQSAVYAATVDGTVYGTQYATNYAQRSAIGSAYGNTAYLSRQDNFENGWGSSYFWGHKK